MVLTTYSDYFRTVLTSWSLTLNLLAPTTVGALINP